MRRNGGIKWSSEVVSFDINENYLKTTTAAILFRGSSSSAMGGHVMGTGH